ncbi:MAG: hypothetical protein WC876_00555 [Candidatus Thermoplasmatota archaeon]|jgi:hypothetical protein
MPRGGFAIAVLLVLASGCLGGGPGPVTPGPEPNPTAPLLFTGECENALLFQFVEYADTDRYLPPGFHPRDPQAFLSSPAAFGRAGVLLIVLECLGDDGLAFSSASVDIFIEAPLVEGLEPAAFNFYEVERVSPPGPWDSVLAGADWPILPGTASVNITFGVVATQSAIGSTEVRDNQGQRALFVGAMDAPVSLGNATVRFWRQGPAGLAYLEYSANLQPIAGGGTCYLREGTAMAVFARSTPAGNVGPINELACPPGDPIIATFPVFRVNATAVSLPGVHAQ